MKNPDLVWTAYLVGTLAVFAILETRALQHPEPGHTLSEYTRKWTGFYPKRHGSWRALGTVTLVGLPAWFAVHILAKEIVGSGPSEQ